MNAIVDAIDAAPRAGGAAVAPPLDEQVRFFEDILAEWLADPDTTVACGRWS